MYEIPAAGINQLNELYVLFFIDKIEVFFLNIQSKICTNEYASPAC